MYQCNCGELFNSHEARTVHTTSCPVMVDKTPIEAKDTVMRQEKLHETYFHNRMPWPAIEARCAIEAQAEISFKAGIEKGRRTERTEWIKAALRAGGMISKPNALIKWIKALKGGKDA